MEREITREQLDLPRQWEGKLAYLLHNVLSKKECENIIARAEKTGFEPASFNRDHKRHDDIEDFGNCSRCALESADDVNKIWGRIRPFIPETWNKRQVAGLNEQIRVLRYDQNENFHPHLDGSNVKENGNRSYMSVLVFLNEGFEGGNTTFLCMSEEVRKEVIPKTGSVLVFEHNILHEGSRIKSGRKYLLRTDVMYSSETIAKKSKLDRLLHLFKT